MVAEPDAPIGAQLGAGREAEVYAWGDAVIKLYRPYFGGHRTEAAVLSTLDGRGLSPKLIDVANHDGRVGLVLERLDGPDMLTLLERRPWRLFSLALTLATTQLAVHDIPAPADLPDLRSVLAGRIGDADLPPQLRGHALRVLDGLPDGDRLCHGDLHPGNVLVAADRVTVIDWPNATRGAPDADHARTLLLLRWANPLPGTPLVSRWLIATGRSLFAHTYTRTYTRSHRMPRSVNSWLVVHSAARLSEGIDAERPILIELLNRAWHNSTR